VEAIYENGVLRPVHPLNLRENEMVHIRLMRDRNEGHPEVLQDLVDVGVLTPPVGNTAIQPVTEQELVENAEALGREPGTALSEIIIGDRGDQ
jgi:predicted DNA-binding antitoxin AbrB/MazE fold protein